MMELRNADNCNHNYDAEQHEKAPADDFLTFMMILLTVIFA